LGDSCPDLAKAITANMLIVDVLKAKSDRRKTPFMGETERGRMIKLSG